MTVGDLKEILRHYSDEDKIIVEEIIDEEDAIWHNISAISEMYSVEGTVLKLIIDDEN